MKNIFFITVIAIFLFACAPAEIPPTSTPIPPTSTTTPPPTTTPLPTATNSPTAVPTVEEKAFHSCVDLDLIAVVIENVSLQTGHGEFGTTDDMLVDFKAFLKSKGTRFGYGSDEGFTLTGGGYYLGYGEISLEGRSGFRSDDVLVCDFMLMENGRIVPQIRAYTKNGEFRELGSITDGRDSDNWVVKKPSSLSELKTVLKSVPVGSPAVIKIQTLKGIDSASDINAETRRQKFVLGNWMYAADLIEAMGGTEYIKRMHAVPGLSIADFVDALDPAIGDIGLFSHIVRYFYYYSD